jgi:UDP-N-acetylmuramate--alanine ligase
LNLKVIHSIYFIGIGGIGMSNLARYMMHIGKKVSGYDKTLTPITDALLIEGIEIRFAIDLAWVLQQNFDKSTTLIVYTPAVKQAENEELNYFLTNDFQVIKRSQLLGIITQNTTCLAVAGTHGKTTTSSMLGHILKSAGVSATSFLGGIAENYHTNLILGGSEFSVVEADEFDRSFLHLHPDYACITAIDADHLDIYKDEADFAATFQEFADLVQTKLMVRKGIPIEGFTYGIEDGADYEAQKVRVENGAFHFDVHTPDGFYANMKLYLPGRHNVLNALAALSLAQSIGVTLPQIAKAFESFKGVQRRFSYRIRTEDRVLIDDYAHHPTEIDALYNAVRELYPEDKILIFFQPHLYTRTRDFEAGFVKSLAQFDQVGILPIYEAREHPIDGVNSNVLVSKIKLVNADVALIQPNQILDTINSSGKRIVLMVGAGDIGEMVTKITRQFDIL